MAASQEVDPKYNPGWEFFVDSAFAGNDEPQNNRRSQTGYVALLNGAPVMWASKVTSVAMADSRIGGAHPDVSSGAAGLYAAGNVPMRFVHLSHVMDEMGIGFSEPYKLQMDNNAAQSFAQARATKTKLKHNDVRQDWVHVLRDSKIYKLVHVDTSLNLADIFIKILTAHTFTALRDRMLHGVPTVPK